MYSVLFRPRERERERERERDRETERQRDRERQRETETETDGPALARVAVANNRQQNTIIRVARIMATESARINPAKNSAALWLSVADCTCSESV